MGIKFLSKKALFDLLDYSIKENDNPSEVIQEINTELTSILISSLRSSEWWPMEHFLTLALGFYFTEKVNEPNYVEDTDPYYQGRNTLIAVPKSIDDIKRLISEIESLYSQKLETLKSAANVNEVSNPSSPINWLEFAQKTDSRTSGSYDNSAAIFSERNIYISKIMASHIRYNYYKIDADLAEEGIFPISRYSVSEAADELKISKDELIVQCFKNNFGIYLKSGKYKIKKLIHSPVTRSSINSTAEFSYVHQYKGHVRLMKSSVFYPDATVEKIYQGGIIEVCSKDNYSLVPLQPSVAECSQGLSLYIELRGNEKITLDDFVLVKEEIEQFKIEKINSSNISNEAAITEISPKNEETQHRYEVINPPKEAQKLTLIIAPDNTTPLATETTTISQSIINTQIISSTAANEYVFLSKGAVFEIRYGGELAHLPVRLGLKYIEQLLKNPRKSINALELVQLINFKPNDLGVIESSYELHEQGICDSPFSGGSYQPILDEQAMREYKQRLSQIEEDIIEAENANNTEELENLKDEQDSILKDITANSKLNKQSKTFKTLIQQASESVRQNIKRALIQIKAVHPKLHEHLRLYLKAGNTCQYTPTETISWG